MLFFRNVDPANAIRALKRMTVSQVIANIK